MRGTRDAAYRCACGRRRLGMQPSATGTFRANALGKELAGGPAQARWTRWRRGGSVRRSPPLSKRTPHGRRGSHHRRGASPLYNFVQFLLQVFNSFFPVCFTVFFRFLHFFKKPWKWLGALVQVTQEVWVRAHVACRSRTLTTPCVSTCNSPSARPVLHAPLKGRAVGGFLRELTPHPATPRAPPPRHLEGTPGKGPGARSRPSRQTQKT